jgi:hypothetical protein
MSFAESGAGQEDAPAMADIVSNVRNATLPKVPFAAQVEQVITLQPTAATVQSVQKAAAQVNVTMQLSQSGFSAHAGADSQNKTTAESSQGQSPVQVVFNPVQTLQDMLNWQVAITPEVYSGRPCYKIVGQSPGPLSATAFVDRERWCMYTVAVKMAERTVIDATAEYDQLPSGLWVPTRIVILHPTEGVQIAQRFSEFKEVQ